MGPWAGPRVHPHGEWASSHLSEPEGCAKEPGDTGLGPARLRSCYSARPSASAPRHPAFLGALNTHRFLQEPRVDWGTDPHNCLMLMAAPAHSSAPDTGPTNLSPKAPLLTRRPGPKEQGGRTLKCPRPGSRAEATRTVTHRPSGAETGGKQPTPPVLTAGRGQGLVGLHQADGAAASRPPVQGPTRRSRITTSTMGRQR